MKKVAMDSGKYQNKAITKKNGKIERVLFRSQMKPTEESSAKGSKNFVVEYGGQKFILGKRAGQADFEKDKATLIHKISTYTAISQLVDNGDEVELAIGYPIDLFMNVTKRNEMEKYIMDNEDIHIKVDGEEKYFKIKKVKVLPESSGVIFNNFDEYRDKTVAVFDWGGLNINGCIFQDGDYIDETYFTLNKGANILWNELKNALNEKYGTNIQDYQRQDILEDGYIKNDKESSKEFIKNFIANFIKIEIMKEATKKQWDFNTLKHIVFAGGSSLEFKKYINYVFEDAKVSENAIWENVEGFGFVIGL